MKLPRLQQDRRRRLESTASGQGGYFTTRQASAAGYSTPLQHHHSSTGNWQRVERGIYRLPYWPSAGHDELIISSLWSGDKGVVSHDSALAFHGISDVLPDAVHLTVPRGFRKRRSGVILHRDVIPAREIEQQQGFRVTTVLRTIADVARSAASQEHVAGAVRDGIRMGLLRERKLLDLALDLPHDAAVRLRAALKAAEIRA